MRRFSNAIALLLLANVYAIHFVEASAKKKKKDGLRRQSEVQRSHIAMESRIVGGVQSAPGRYPYFVGWDGCGASLIHEDIILSAAHCNPITENKVYIGAFRRETLQGGAEERFITERRMHPEYDDWTLANDFLVMKINEPSTKEPVEVNDLSSVPSGGETLTVMGFGARNEGGSVTNFLREVDVFAIDHETCNGSNMYDGEVYEDIMLCAGIPDDGGKDSCQGDSGGPIVDSNGTQVGVVSWGYGCADPNYPGVYSRTSGVIDWIKQQVCELAENKPEYCGDLPTEAPAPEGTVAVKLALFFDEYPEEVGITLTNENGDVIMNYNVGSFANVFYNTFRESFYLEPGRYEVAIEDSYGDGLCCTYGDGGLEVSARMADGTELTLASSDGIFTNDVRIEFEVPEPPTGSPEPPTGSPATSPTAGPAMEPPGDCEDKEGTFLIDSGAGEQNCAFLGENLVRYGYLCQFLDVASECPRTCDACDYFRQ